MAELIIDSNYYNKLDIEGFSKMMSFPSYCYKFYWLEAIVQLISASRTEATYDEIINKRIIEWEGERWFFFKFFGQIEFLRVCVISSIV